MQHSIQGEPKAGEHDAYCPGRDWGHIFEIGNPTQHQENGREADHVQPQILERRNGIAYLSAMKKKVMDLHGNLINYLHYQKLSTQ